MSLKAVVRCAFVAALATLVLAPSFSGTSKGCSAYTLKDEAIIFVPSEMQFHDLNIKRVEHIPGVQNVQAFHGSAAGLSSCLLVRAEHEINPIVMRTMLLSIRASRKRMRDTMFTSEYH